MMKRDMGSKKLATAGVFSALGVGLLFLAALMPTGKLAVVALAGLVTAAVLISCGAKCAWCTWFVTAAAGMLLVPDKSLILMFFGLFGFYPILKHYIERIGRLIPEWALKLLFLNAALCTGIFLLSEIIILPESIHEQMYGLVLLAANVVFVVYDIGLSRLLGLYTKFLVSKRK